MAQWLKQSTAITIQLGPFLDETDGKTAETGLTISQADVKLSKGGAAFAQKNDANAATHDAGGWYRCQLDATDTGTLGRLIVAVHESGALPVWREFMVVPANEYDSLISGSDALQVDAVEISGDSTAADNAELAYDGTGYAFTGCTVPWNASWDAEVQSEVDDALVANNLDHLCKTATAGADMTTEVVDNSILSRILANGDTSAFDPSTDGLQLIRDALTSLDVTGDVVDSTYTLGEALALILAVVAGKASGGGTTTIAYRDLADTKNRVELTVDVSGNRTAVSLDET